MKTILFDLDNTLIDYMKMKKASSKAAVDAMIACGLNITAKEAFDTLMKMYFEIGFEHEKIFQEFLNRTHKKIDFKILAAGITAYRRTQFGMMQPYPGIIPVLLKIKQNGLKLGIVSDAPKFKVWIRLTELGLQDYFDAVIGFDDTNQRKPSDLPFKKALETLNSTADSTLMIGDSPERDIAGAKAIGMCTCFARYGFQWGEPPKKGESGAQFEIDDPKELLNILKI